MPDTWSFGYERLEWGAHYCPPSVYGTAGTADSPGSPAAAGDSSSRAVCGTPCSLPASPARVRTQTDPSSRYGNWCKQGTDPRPSAVDVPRNFHVGYGNQCIESVQRPRDAGRDG